MNSQEIQEYIVEWAHEQNFNAPYGIISSSHINKKGRKYLAVTFGRARTLDATVEIYNRNFIILRSSRNHSGEVYRNIDDLKQALSKL